MAQMFSKFIRTLTEIVLLARMPQLLFSIFVLMLTEIWSFVGKGFYSVPVATGLEWNIIYRKLRTARSEGSWL